MEPFWNGSMFYVHLAEPPLHDGSDSNSKATSTANLTIEAKAKKHGQPFLGEEPGSWVAD
jgi:hypothetical protein